MVDYNDNVEMTRVQIKNKFISNITGIMLQDEDKTRAMERYQTIKKILPTNSTNFSYDIFNISNRTVSK